MLNMGFKEDVEKILESTDNERRQTVRFFFFFASLISYNSDHNSRAQSRETVLALRCEQWPDVFF